MASDYDPGILGVVVPQKCSCQFFLSGSTIVKAGWLRRKCLRNKFQLKMFNWPQVYVIVADKCLYYFKNELANKPSGAVSLYGFNKVKRFKQQHPNDPAWAFKLEHVQPDIRSFHFAASSEQELVKWMQTIKQEMLLANNRTPLPPAPKSSSDEASLASSESWGSTDYNDLEGSIYNEPQDERPVSSIYVDSEYDDGFDDSDESEDGFEPIAVKPESSLVTTLAKKLKEQKLTKGNTLQ